MTTPPQSLDVLIVGAGPTGMVLAAELARHGLRCRIIDQAAAPTVWSKAQIIHSRSLEVFEHLGLADQLMAHGKPWQAANMYPMVA